MRWARLFVVVVFAAMAFGGSFECHGSSNHRRHDDDDARRGQPYAVDDALTSAVA